MLSLKAILGLDATSYELGLKRAQSAATKFGNSIKGEVAGKVGALFTVAAVEEGIRHILNYAGHIKDLSDQLDISTDAVQQWDYAVKQSGGTAEQVASFFENLAKSREAALSGDQGAKDAFKKFGVSESDLRNKRLEDIGLQIGDAVKAGDAQKLIASLKEIGGKGAGALIASMKAGLREAMGDAPLIKPEYIIQLDEIGDKFTQLGQSIMAKLAPILAEMAKAFQKYWLDVKINGLRQLAAFSEAFAKTGSLEKAKAAMDHESKLIAKEEGKREAARIAAEEDAKKKGKGGSDARPPMPKDDPLFPEIGKEDQHQSVFKSNIRATQLQEIGAKVSFNPLQNEIQRNTQAVKDNTNAMVRQKNQHGRNRFEGFDGNSFDGGNTGRGVNFG